MLRVIFSTIAILLLHIGVASGVVYKVDRLEHSQLLLNPQMIQDDGMVVGLCTDANDDDKQNVFVFNPCDGSFAILSDPTSHIELINGDFAGQLLVQIHQSWAESVDFVEQCWEAVDQPEENNEQGAGETYYLWRPGGVLEPFEIPGFISPPNIFMTNSRRQMYVVDDESDELNESYQSYFVTIQPDRVEAINISNMLPEGYWAIPISINDQGAMLLWLMRSAQYSPSLGMCLYHNGVLTMLQATEASDDAFVPTAMNGLSDIVGIAMDSTTSKVGDNDEDSPGVGMIWTHDGHKSDIDIIPSDINDSRQIVGHLYQGWDERLVMRIVERIFGYGPSPYNLGEDTHAAIWDPENGTQDLNDLIAIDKTGLDESWVLTNAYKINCKGQILAKGETKGYLFSALLTPVDSESE